MRPTLHFVPLSFFDSAPPAMDSAVIHDIWTKTVLCVVIAELYVGSFFH